MQTIKQFTTSMLSAIEFAPPAAPGAPGLQGFFCPVEDGDAYICSPCAGRIMARGCALPDSTPVWTDEPIGTCVCCANRL